MKYIEDAYIQCPFYTKEGKNFIICEGLFDGCTNRINFRVGKKAFKECYCKTDYTKCRLFSALMDKYPD